MILIGLRTPESLIAVAERQSGTFQLVLVLYQQYGEGSNLKNVTLNDEAHDFFSFFQTFYLQDVFVTAKGRRILRRH